MLDRLLDRALNSVVFPNIRRNRQALPAILLDELLLCDKILLLPAHDRQPRPMFRKSPRHAARNARPAACHNRDLTL